MNKILPELVAEEDFEFVSTIHETSHSTVRKVRFKDPRYKEVAAVYKTPSNEWPRYFKKEVNMLLHLRERANNGHHPHLVLDFVYLFNEQGLLFPQAKCDLIDVAEMNIWSSDLKKEFHIFRNPIEVFRQLISAVDFLRQCGVVHLDIKPHNFLFFSEGNIKLIDFGLGELRERIKPDSPSLCRYTTGYTPPEYQALKAFMLQEAKKSVADVTCDNLIEGNGFAEDENLMMSILQSQGYTFPADGSSDLWAVAKTMMLLVNLSIEDCPDCAHCGLKHSWDSSFPKSELDDPDSFTRNLVHSLSLEPVLEEFGKGTNLTPKVFVEYAEKKYRGNDKDLIIKDLEALSPILEECLHFDPHRRPSSESVLKRICELGQNKK